MSAQGPSTTLPEAPDGEGGATMTRTWLLPLGPGQLTVLGTCGPWA